MQGKTVEEVKASRVVEDHISVYTLIFEAEGNAQAVSGLQDMMASGHLDWAFKRVTGEGAKHLAKPGAPRVRRRRTGAEQ